MEGGSSVGNQMQAGAKSQLTSSGGMRQTFAGSISEEHLDEAAASGAGQTQQQTQQASVLGQQGAMQAAAASQGAGSSPLAQTPEKTAVEPRSVSNLPTELIKRPVVDVIDSVKAAFDINRLLNIQVKTPEAQAKQKQVAARWQKLTAAEQEVAQQKYQENLQKKRQEEEQAAEKKRQEEDAKQAELPVPVGRKTGFQGFGGMSGSTKAKTMIQRQQTTLGGAE